MMLKPFDLGVLIQELSHLQGLLELALLLLLVLLSWGLTYLARGARREHFVWFGQRLLDGLFFPVLLLMLSYGASRWLMSHELLLFSWLIVPLLMALTVIRLCAQVLRAAFPFTATAVSIERLISWGAWLIFALWITGLLPWVAGELQDIHLKLGKQSLTLYALLEGSITAGLVFILTLWVSAALEARLMRSQFADLSARRIVANVLRVLLLFLGLVLVLSSLGIDLTALSVIGGALGVGLGLGLQKLAANYVSGFVILAERSLRIGDVVKIDQIEGRITDIKSRYTLIRSGNGREAVIPNELLVTQKVENFSLADHQIMLSTVVTFAHHVNPESVRSIFMQVTLAHPQVLTAPAPSVHLTELMPEGLRFNLNFWVEVDEASQMEVRSQINELFLQGVRQAGLELAVAPFRV